MSSAASEPAGIPPTSLLRRSTAVPAARLVALARAVRVRLRAWPLRRRLLLLFASVGLALALSVGLVSAAVVHLNDTVHQQVDRIDPARVAGEDFLSALVNQETGVRGYVLTGNRSFLGPYTQGRQQEAHAYSLLSRLLPHERVLTGELAALAAAASKWQRFTADQQIADMAGGAAGSARSPAMSALGQTEFDIVRSRAARLLGTLATRHAAADAAISEADGLLVALLVVALVLLLLTLEGTLVALRRWVTQPLASVASDARTVAGGDLAHAIGPAGPPDIQSLADDVDAMRTRIVEQLAAVEESKRLLDDQADLLRRSNADLEQFAYLASHDLQEPLRKISSFSDLVVRRYEHELDDRGKEYLGYLADGARRMQALINDILQLSKVGRDGSKTELVDCTELARTAVSHLADEVSSSGATVIVRRLPVVTGDSRLLSALFENLIGNSVKFRSVDPPYIVIDAVELHEKPAATSVEEGGDGHPKVFKFSVRDNGMGIDPRDGDRIFTMFQRLHSREQYGGTGIGLALCKRIVEHHGGRIWLEQPSQGQERGAVISFTLPG